MLTENISNDSNLPPGVFAVLFLILVSAKFILVNIHTWDGTAEAALQLLEFANTHLDHVIMVLQQIQLGLEFPSNEMLVTLGNLIRDHEGCFDQAGRWVNDANYDEDFMEIYSTTFEMWREVGNDIMQAYRHLELALGITESNLEKAWYEG